MKNLFFINSKCAWDFRFNDSPSWLSGSALGLVNHDNFYYHIKKYSKYLTINLC